MKKAYLLSFNEIFGDNKSVSETLDQMYMVEKWRYDMRNTIYIISEHSAKEIARTIREKRANGIFLVSEVSANAYGWLTKESWHLIQTKEYKPE